MMQSATCPIKATACFRVSTAIDKKNLYELYGYWLQTDGGGGLVVWEGVDMGASCSTYMYYEGR